MQEYTLTIQKALAVGLRNTEDNPKNVSGLTFAQGVLQKAGTLVNLDLLTNFDISTIVACDFPFPQMFQLREWTLICTPTKIYTFDGTSLTSVYTAVEGTTWTYGDFYNYLILTNGQELITLDPDTGVWSKYLDCKIPYCVCLCDVNGQVFVGGPEVSVSAGWLGD